MKKLLLFTLGALLLCSVGVKAAVDSTLCSVKLTLNMSEQIKKNAFVVDTDFVDVAGSFNGWNGANHHLVKSEDNDSIYSIQIDSISLDGLIEFKFRINGVWEQGKSELWGSAPNRKLQPRAVKDGGIIEITKYFDNYRTGYVPVNLSVDMSSAKLNGKFNPAINFVDVAGSFNGWGGNDQLIGDDTKTIYSASVLAPSGAEMQYKFRIDGSWADDKSEFPGGGPNRVYVVKDTAGGVSNDVPVVFFNNEVIKVDSTLIVPAYPTASSKVSIYINANHFGFDQTSDLSAWTGLITSESNNATGDWKNNPISDWNDLSVKLRRLNDSIHVIEIPSIRAFYNVPAGVEVFRIAFIARDSANNKPKSQTDNLYFEVYGKNPVDLYSTQPAKPKESIPVVVTLNVKQIKRADKNLGAYLDTAINKDVYAFTALNSGWTNTVASWDSITNNEVNNLKTIAINDSIYRFFIMPTARTFYGLTDTCERIHTVNLVFRNKEGNAQSEDIKIQFDTSKYVSCEPVGITIIGSRASINVYPNPAVNQITVSSDEMISEIRISNLMGQQLKSINGMNNTSAVVPVNELQNGIYIYMVKTSNNQVVTGKLIKK